ncbi:hypothetical protein AYO45_02290 [Gammaproteobacteria bacterium SCGC AG-212-F23]|nr:hypothetical protein AYO45_02290 [Gammaproteobacteria bacterium SCGC AG-212-F23]
MQQNQNWMTGVVVFLTSLGFFTIGLGSQEIIGFESRFYLFLLEMWRHGGGFFPTAYGQAYPDYPASAIWLMYVLAKTVGVVNKWVAVYPSAIAASMTVAVTYAIGVLRDKRVGILASGFLCLTLAFVSEARTISLDMYPTLMTALCFYVMYSATIFRCYLRLYWLPLLWIVGFVFRGPLGFVIPVSVVFVFYLFEKDWKKLFVLTTSALVILIACCSALLYFAYLTGGESFMQEVIRMQFSGRMQANQTPPFYFYFVESIGAYALTYPLVLFCVFYFRKKIYFRSICDEVIRLDAYYSHWFKYPRRQKNSLYFTHCASVSFIMRRGIFIS